ncbi:putative membrane protein [Dysgonomonas hofstadii]|uniref:Putative membrane protein n=1 Tax=Dysgonomonas hofstadii TaxID=637886 RepID=A0A840CXS8_9BACT|nr:LiaF domain-containing protein [Dysgonomonas hofstadii]MBB4037222.1 putative membrane protein [Dysgonomonas hofstadii]
MENEIKNKHFCKRGRGGDGVGFALFLILFGGVFLCLNTGVIPEIYRPVLISWQMLLIVIGLWTAIVKQHYGGGIILTLVGLVFIYPKLSLLFPGYLAGFNIDIRTYWPVILIIAGLILILGWRFPNKRKRHWEKHFREEERQTEACGGVNYNSTDYIDKNLLFGGSEQIVLSNNFRGGEGNVMFGELIIDLRRAKLAEGTHKLELNAMFGSAILYVTPDWNLEMRSSSFLASVEDKRYQATPVANSTSTLIVKSSAMFGNIEIRN